MANTLTRISRIVRTTMDIYFNVHIITSKIINSRRVYCISLDHGYSWDEYVRGANDADNSFKYILGPKWRMYFIHVIPSHVGRGSHREILVEFDATLFHAIPTFEIEKIESRLLQEHVFQKVKR